jgi:hypothetical protein
MVGQYDAIIRDLEQHVLAATKANRAKELCLLRAV